MMLNPKKDPPGTYIRNITGMVSRVKEYMLDGRRIATEDGMIRPAEDFERLYTVYDLQSARCQLEPMVCLHCKSTELWYDQRQGDAKCGTCGRWQTTLSVGKPYRWEYIQHAMSQYPVTPDPLAEEEPSEIHFGMTTLWFWEDDDSSVVVATFVLSGYRNGTIWTCAYLSAGVFQDDD